MLADLQCTERFAKAISWLKNEIVFNESKLTDRINELQNIRSNPARDKDAFDYFLPDDQIESLQKKLRTKYKLEDTEGMFVFKKLGLPVINDFIKAAACPEFWDDADGVFFDDPHVLWFLSEVGLSGNSFFEECVDNCVNRQLITGHIEANTFDHVGPLRVFVATRHDSENMNRATKYWLANWEAYRGCPHELSLGTLALSEIDYDCHLPIIRKHIDYLKRIQRQDGSWPMFLSTRKDKSGIHYIVTTGYAVWAIARLNGNYDEHAKSGLGWICSQQLENGSWDNDPHFTTSALFALLAMGEGPRVPLEQVNFESVKLAQRSIKQKPVFLHTSPFYKDTSHVREINDNIIRMLHRARNTIRISSLYIDMLYEEIINIKMENPSMVVKVITRRQGKAEGLRGDIAHNAIRLLNKETRGNLVESQLVHARMIIIDDSEVLVSSSDLTRDQLYDQFNAGIWTQDKETVIKAIEFFDNLFELENKGKTNFNGAN